MPGNNLTRLTILLIVSLLYGCTQSGEEESVIPPPTVNPTFLNSTPTSKAPAVAVASVTATPIPTPLPTPVLPSPIVIFDEALNSDWNITVLDPQQLQLDYSENAYRGSNAIAFSPHEDAYTLLFTLRPEAERVYLADDLLAITFYLFSPSGPVSGGDVAMTILGSNELPYYDAADESVQLAANPNPGWKPIYDPISNRYGETFSETWISFLGVQNTLPRDTWVWVTNWFDDRKYDPEYLYVTGFYVKGEFDFEGTLVLDNVEIITFGE